MVTAKIFRRMTIWQYPFGNWRDSRGSPVLTALQNADEGVWPREFQNAVSFMRAGLGSLDSTGQEDPNDGTVAFRRSHFPPDGLRKRHHTPIRCRTLRRVSNTGFPSAIATGFGSIQLSM